MRSSARAGTVSASAPSSQTSPRHLPDIRQRGHYSCGGLPRAPVQGGCPAWGGPLAWLDPGGSGDQAPGEWGRFGDGDADGAPLEAERTLNRDDEVEVQRVAGVARDDVADDGPPEQRQITDEIEHFVPNELVAVAEAVQDAPLAYADRVLERRSAGQAPLAHRSQVLEKAVRAGGSEVLDEHLLRRRARERLGADGRMVVVKGIADPEHVGRDDLDPAPSTARADRIGDHERTSWRGLLRAPRMHQQRDEGLGAAVDRGDLRAVHIDGEVVETEAGCGRQQVLDRLDPGSIAANRGGVMAVHHALHCRGSRLVVVVRSEGDACVPGG